MAKAAPQKRRKPGAVLTFPESKQVESRALAKGLQLLEELAQLHRPASLSELARRCSLGKASTFRLLQTLVTTKYVAQNSYQEYELNREWVPSLTQDWLRKLLLAARPEMEFLNTELGETVSLAVLFEDHIRVVETLESSHQIRMSNYRDRILPPYASSLGKAIAAFQPAHRLQTLLQVYGIYATTDRTVVDPAGIRQEMARTRERYYAFEREETVRGGCCFGAPIFTDGDQVSSAVSVSLPTARLTEDLETKVPPLVLEVAARISKAMGGTSPTPGYRAAFRQPQSAASNLSQRDS